MHGHPGAACAPPPEGTFAPTSDQERWLRTHQGMIARLKGLEDNQAALQTVVAELVNTVAELNPGSHLIELLALLGPKTRKELEEKLL